MWPLLAGLLAGGIAAPAQAQVSNPDPTLTHPRNPVARNFGVWDGGIEDRENAQPQPGNIIVNRLEFRRNDFEGIRYSECFTLPFFHAQHIVRMPNKNGHAYFMVSNSDGISLLFETMEPAGRMSVYRSDSLDPVTDLVPDSTRADGTHGEIVWEHIFDYDSLFGHWNHPAKMELIGNLLLVAMQNWGGTVCDDGENNGQEMAIVFFDVRDPENPKYWGKMTASQLGVSKVEEVSLVKAGEEWILSTKGRWWKTQKVTPDLSQWTFGGTCSFPGNLQGQNFNSYELYDLGLSAPPNTALPGTDRVMWGNGEGRDGCGCWKEDDDGNSYFEPNHVSGNEYLIFSQLNFTPPGDTNDTVSFAPTATATYAANRNPLFRAAPNLWTIIGGEFDGEHYKDYDACGVSVRRGMPVFYSPLVYYQNLFFSLTSDDKIFQIWHPDNHALQTAPAFPLPDQVVTSTNDSGVGSLRRAMGFGGTRSITFAPSLNGKTITLTKGPFVTYPGDTLTIDASALPDGISISGGGVSGVFEITEGVQVTMKKLTIRDGFARHGAGLLNVGGTVTLENCTIANNRAIKPPGSPSAGSGAGILNGAGFLDGAPAFGDMYGGTLTLTNCTVAQNHAEGDGGGICNIGGRLTVEASTIVSNRSEGFGGALCNQIGLTFNAAPQFAPRNGNVFLRNSTITGNTTPSATGGSPGLHNDSRYSSWLPQLGIPGTNVMSMVHCTLANNTNEGSLGFSGAVYNLGGGILNVENSILANNLSGPFASDIRGDFTTTAANIIKGNNGVLLGGPVTLSTDPLLGPLVNNGGPTLTMMMAFNSPAIGKAIVTTNSPATDQRGATRPQGSLPDLGAVESPAGDPSALANAVDNTDLRNLNSVVGPNPNYTAVWFSQTNITHDGVDAAQSGNLPDDKLSALTAEVIGPGTLTFWWKINAGVNDRLSLYMFQVGVLAGPIFGNTGWNQVSVAIPAGTNLVGWEYDTDFTGSMPGGAGWVDQVVFTPIIPTPVVLNTNNSGAGSLRQTIAEFPAGTVITFAPSLSGKTITLTSGQLLLNKNLAIDASALPNGIVISGNNASRVIEVSNAIVSLLGLTLTKGKTTNDGGGISYSGTLVLINSTVTGCSARRGGGIYHNFVSASDSLRLYECTVSMNSATNLAGVGRGGGIYSRGGTLELRNTTVAGNQSPYGAGVYNEYGQVSILHSTLAENFGGLGGGLYHFADAFGGGLSLENSIIARNTASGSPDFFNAGPLPLMVSGADLIGNNAGAGTNFPAGPLVGTPASPLNPRLAPLANYGGRTQTMPPLPGSPAIESAVLLVGTPATDQRGASRPTGPQPDLGAVEAFAFSSITKIDTDNDGIDDRLEPAYGLVVGVNNSATDSDGDGSSDAVELANMTNPNDPNDNFRILSFAVDVTPAQAQNPLQDGGFELSLTAGPGTYNYLSNYGAWTTTQGTTAILGMPYAGMPAYEGTEALHVGDSFGVGAVRQSFATTTGQKYWLSLAVIGWGGGAGTVRATVFNTGNTNLVADFAAPGGNVWGTNGYEFVATSSLCTLQLRNISGASTIDDVRVTGIQPVVCDLTLHTFPGLGYALESSATLQSFQTLSNSTFIATDHAQTINVILAPGQRFIRARRN